MTTGSIGAHRPPSLVLGLAAAVVTSAGISLLMLAVPLFSMQVFDRVLGSGHVETLVMLCVVAGLALLAFAGLEAVRASLLMRSVAAFEASLVEPLLRQAIRAGAPGGQGLRDLGTIRAALTGPALLALFDLPWVPLAILILALLDGTLAWFAAVSALLLLALALLNGLIAEGRLRRSGQAQLDAQVLAEAAGRKGEVVRALGMGDTLIARIAGLHRAGLLDQGRAGERSGVVMGITRALRLGTQCGVMALGAWLVLESRLTPGGMLAASILLSKALAPIEQIVGAWRMLSAARESWARVCTGLARQEADDVRTSLPAPAGRLALEGVRVTTERGVDLLHGIDLQLAPGQCLAVVGASGSGKSTLCRVLAGLLPPGEGSVRLDGASLQHYRPDELGPAVGYLPQEPMLFAGTVRANIARLQPDADDAAVVAAARLAGAHEMILGLPEGYDTMLADGGAPLSGGQRQRLGLARALFGRPRLIVLDEPNSQLDAAGDTALADTIERLKADEATIVLVTHRPQALQKADLLLVLEHGRVARFGPCQQVMANLVRPVRAA